MIIIKIVLLTALISLAIVGLYFLLGLIIPYIPYKKDFPHLQGPDFETIYLKSDGLHTDIVVPVRNLLFNWQSFLNKSDFESLLEQDGYLAFGWGDKGFYLEIPEWKDLTLKIAFKAMCVPSPTVMHVIYMKEPPTEFKYFKAIDISAGQYHALINYILSYFQIKDGQNMLIKGLGYTPDDNFYESTSPYHALITCNEWVNIAMKKIGIKTAIWSPGGFGLFLHDDKEEHYSFSPRSN